jgi:hypothetical protein
LVGQQVEIVCVLIFSVDFPLRGVKNHDDVATRQIGFIPQYRTSNAYASEREERKTNPISEQHATLRGIEKMTATS